SYPRRSCARRQAKEHFSRGHLAADDTKATAELSPIEKRKHVRAAVTLLVEYEGADELLSDWTDNLSTGGTLVATTRELAQATVRNELGMKHVPVIAGSAGGDSARAAAMAAGADIFIEKPMRLRQVIETMRSLMKL